MRSWWACSASRAETSRRRSASLSARALQRHSSLGAPAVDPGRPVEPVGSEEAENVAEPEESAAGVMLGTLVTPRVHLVDYAAPARLPSSSSPVERVRHR